MSDDYFPVPAEWAASALFDREGRAADYARSVEDAMPIGWNRPGGWIG